MIDLNDTALPRIPFKCRVTLLALGDVGSTLLTGLRLMGGDVIGSIGICDVRPGVSERWEFELNQIQSPDGAALPPVDIITPEQLFDGDVFLFCASRMIPDTSVTAGDVRPEPGTGVHLRPHGPGQPVQGPVLRGQRSGGPTLPCRPA